MYACEDGRHHGDVGYGHPHCKEDQSHRPDICLRDKKANTCLLIDISCPANGNVGRKHAEKLAK